MNVLTSDNVIYDVSNIKEHCNFFRIMYHISSETPSDDLPSIGITNSEISHIEYFLNNYQSHKQMKTFVKSNINECIWMRMLNVGEYVECNKMIEVYSELIYEHIKNIDPQQIREFLLRKNITKEELNNLDPETKVYINSMYKEEVDKLNLEERLEYLNGKKKLFDLNEKQKKELDVFYKVSE